MSLSKRLHALADIIPSGNRIIDVGCDHALLDIYLIKLGKIKEALAIDINPKSLAKAEDNVKSSKLEKNIKICLNDGLSNVEIFRDDVIVIAGVGRKTIVKILENRISNITKLVLQSNNEHYELRRWLHKNGLIITSENFIVEHHKAYIIMALEKGNKAYNYFDYWLGPYLKDNKKYLNYIYEYYFNLEKQIPKRNFIRRFIIKKKTLFLKKKSRSI